MRLLLALVVACRASAQLPATELGTTHECATSNIAAVDSRGVLRFDEHRALTSLEAVARYEAATLNLNAGAQRLASLTLPVWFETYGMFLFRENPRRKPASSSMFVGGQRRAEPVWAVDLAPTPPVLLVDFEGGDGSYVGPQKRSVTDKAGVEMLFLTSDGKLRVARSGRDLKDPDREKREQGWQEWLRKVDQDTLQSKNRAPGENPGAPGGGRQDR